MLKSPNQFMLGVSINRFIVTIEDQSVSSCNVHCGPSNTYSAWIVADHVKSIGMQRGTLKQLIQEERCRFIVDLDEKSIATSHQSLTKPVSIAISLHPTTKVITRRDRLQGCLKDRPIKPPRETGREEERILTKNQFN